MPNYIRPNVKKLEYFKPNVQKAEKLEAENEEPECNVRPNDIKGRRF